MIYPFSGNSTRRCNCNIHYFLARPNSNCNPYLIAPESIVDCNNLGAYALRLLNALNSEDRGLKVRFSLATIAFNRESAQMSQILSSQGKNAPSNPYPHYN